MPIFIKIKDKDRKRLFSLVKQRVKSWENFYPSLKISRTMFFNYLSGRYDLSKELFNELQKIAKINIPEYNEIYKPKYTKKNIPKIKLDKKLAEIFGVLNGDGHISKFKNEVCIVGDSREKEYFNYLKSLFEKKFKIKFTFFCEPTRIKLRTYSIKLSKLLTEGYGLPKGNKLGKLKIPSKVYTSKKLLLAYLRGLFDTDGSFYIRRKKDPVVEITSADKCFLRQIKEALISLDFHVAKGNNRIFIYRKGDIIKFFKVIKPANSKHLKKYQSSLNL